QLLGDRDAGLVVDAGERLAAVERGALAIERAMVVRRELRVAAQLSRQEAGGERDPRDYADVAAAGLLEEELRGPLPDDVDDDLDRRDDRVLDRLQPLLDLLDADANMAREALGDQPLA